MKLDLAFNVSQIFQGTDMKMSVECQNLVRIKHFSPFLKYPRHCISSHK